MKTLNRTLILVSPKQPFIDWLVECDFDTEATLELYSNDVGVYLYDEFGRKEFIQMVENNYTKYFEAELASCTLDKEKWPNVNDLRLFQEWFVVTYHSVLSDESNLPLKHEEI